MSSNSRKGHLRRFLAKVPLNAVFLRVLAKQPGVLEAIPLLELPAAGVKPELAEEIDACLVDHASTCTEREVECAVAFYDGDGRIVGMRNVRVRKEAGDAPDLLLQQQGQLFRGDSESVLVMMQRHCEGQTRLYLTAQQAAVQQLIDLTKLFADRLVQSEADARAARDELYQWRMVGIRDLERAMGGDASEESDSGAAKLAGVLERFGPMLLGQLMKRPENPPSTPKAEE